MDFAAKQKRGGQTCTTCVSLVAPLRRQIALAREKDHTISWPIVSQYLTEKYNVTIKPNALRNHFVGGHDKEAA